MARIIVVNDKMQRGYSYELAAPAECNFAPDFEPELTPAEMLQFGVFCGKYLTDCRGSFRRAGSPTRGSQPPDEIAR